MDMEASKRAELVQGFFLKAFLPLLVSINTTEEMFVVLCVCVPRTRAGVKSLFNS